MNDFLHEKKTKTINKNQQQKIFSYTIYNFLLL